MPRMIMLSWVAGLINAVGDLLPMANTFLLFTLEGHCFGVGIDEIIRVYPALEIDEISEGPPLLSGLFTVAGKKIPVLNLRRRLQLPKRVVTPDDVLVVGVSSAVDFAFFADSLIGVHSFSDTEICDSQTVYPELAWHVSRLADFSGKTVWIYTLVRLFAEPDFPALLAAVAKAGNR